MNFVTENTEFAQRSTELLLILCALSEGSVHSVSPP